MPASRHAIAIAGVGRRGRGDRHPGDLRVVEDLLEIGADRDGALLAHRGPGQLDVEVAHHPQVDVVRTQGIPDEVGPPVAGADDREPYGRGARTHCVFLASRLMISLIARRIVYEVVKVTSTQ